MEECIEEMEEALQEMKEKLKVGQSHQPFP